MAKPRILIWDIENLPNKGYFFQLRNEMPIPIQFVMKEHSIISIAYKFYGEKEKGVISIADFPDKLKKDPYDDSGVVKKFVEEILSQADYVVAHYGDRHDTPMLHTRCLMNNIPAPKPIPTIDTWKLIRKHFKLNTNKLDHIATWLGLGNKHSMSAIDWVNCAHGDVKAINKMAKYNMQDVLLLEKVFQKVLPYVETKIYRQPDQCPHCHSTKLKVYGEYFTKTARKIVLRCIKCQSFTNISEKQYDTLLWKRLGDEQYVD